MSRSSFSMRLASLAVGILVAVFILYPIGTMLVRSFEITEAASPQNLRKMSEHALALMAPIERQTQIDRWLSSITPQQRMEAMASALLLNNIPVSWDRTAPFDEQILAAESIVKALPSSENTQVMETLPIACIMLHKRIPLSFKVRDKLSLVEFDQLRSGKHKKYGFQHYIAVIQEHRLRNAAVNSITLALTTTVITTMLAFLIAFGLNRRGVLKPNAARIGILLPLVSPPVVIATAAILLFGRSGVVTRNLLDNNLGLIDAGLTNLYGLHGVILAQILSFLAPAFIVFDNVLSKQDGRLDEAAAIQGCSSWQTFRYVTLPMAQPGFISAATLVFILSMTDFGNPLVIGKDMPVLAGVLYDEMIGFHNTPLASAIAVWLIVPALFIYGLLNRVGRQKRFVSTEVVPADIQLPTTAKVSLSILTWTIIGFTIVIYGTILMGAFVRVWGQDFHFTPHHFTAIDAVPGFVSEYVGVEPVWTSLLVAAIAAPIGGLLSVIIAFLAERGRGWLVAVISFSVMLPAILPGVVFGIGYLVAFNNPLGIRQLSLNSTYTILVLNILFSNVFFGVLSGRAMLKRLDSSVDEAAEILGASLLQRFRLVTLPMMRRAALLGTLYVFIDGMCTFSAVVFLEGPDIDLASVAIFQTASVSYYGTACAMSVTILLIVLVVLSTVSVLNIHGPAWFKDPSQQKRRVSQ